MMVIQSMPENEKTSMIKVVLQQLCRAIDQAHQRGVAHCALSPRSLLLTHGVLTIRDWEWCRPTHSNQSRDERSVYKDPQMKSEHPSDDFNSPVWIAPEIRSGQVVEGEEWFSVDLYSISLFAVYLLTEKIPTLQETDTPLILEEWLFKHLSNRTTSAFINSCRRGLSRQVNQRPSSASELYRSLFNEELT